jgi:hypothetical protein
MALDTMKCQAFATDTPSYYWYSSNRRIHRHSIKHMYEDSTLLQYIESFPASKVINKNKCGWTEG